MVISEEKQIELEATTELARALAVPGLVEEEELGAHHPQVLKANKLAQLKEQLAAADQDTHDAEEYTHTLQYMLNCQRDAHAVERGRLGDLREGKEEVDAQHAEAKLRHGKAVLQMSKRSAPPPKGPAPGGQRRVLRRPAGKKRATPARRRRQPRRRQRGRQPRVAGCRRCRRCPRRLGRAAAVEGGGAASAAGGDEDVVSGAAAGARPARRAGEPVRGGVSEDGARGGVVGSRRRHPQVLDEERGAREIPRRARRRAHAARRPRDRQPPPSREAQRPHPFARPRARGRRRAPSAGAEARREPRTRPEPLRQDQCAAPAAGRGLRWRRPRPPPHRTRADEVGRAARERESGGGRRRSARVGRTRVGGRVGRAGLAAANGRSTASGAAPLDHQLEVPPAPPPAPTLPPEHPYQRDGARARQRRESPQLPSYHLPRRSSSTGSAAAAAASRRERIAERSESVDAAYLSLVSLPSSRLARK